MVHHDYKHSGPPNPRHLLDGKLRLLLLKLFYRHSAKKNIGMSGINSHLGCRYLRVLTIELALFILREHSKHFTLVSRWDLFILMLFHAECVVLRFNCPDANLLNNESGDWFV